MSARAGRRGKTPAHHYLGRFLGGLHMDGRVRSDATFWRRGTAGPPGWFGGGQPSRWAMRAGWSRAAIRLAVVAALVGLWRWRTGTEWALGLAAGPVAGWRVVRVVRAVQAARHQRELIVPLSGALAPFLGVSAGEVAAALEVRPDFDDVPGGEDVGVLQLPDEWPGTPEQRARVQQVIDARLGVELRFRWQTARYPMVVRFYRAPTPPARVAFSDPDVREAIDACAPDRVVLGKAADGSIHYGDLALDDPHWAINAGSRRGKTSLLLLIAAQLLNKGAELVMFIDPKLVGLTAFDGIPGVDIRDNGIEDMWDGIAAFRAFVEGRIAAFKADRSLKFRRATLFIDEVNQFSAMSAQYWRRIKEKSDPAMPPVWDDLAMLVWMGAQFCVNVVIDGQRLDGPTLKDLRDSFGVRLLAGYTPQQYKFLVDISPMQRSQKPRGRFLLFSGGELTWLQLVHGSEAELYDYAMAGREGVPVPVLEAPDLGAMPAPGTGDTGPVIVGLAAAAEHLGMELEAFRKARQRRPVEGEETRQGRPVWSAAALTEWRESRPSIALVSDADADECEPSESVS